MDLRARLPRKAREVALLRKEEENIQKLAKKRPATKESKSVAPKLSKKRGKSEERTKSPVESPNENDKSATNKIENTKMPNGKEKPKRRSRSAEPDLNSQTRLEGKGKRKVAALHVTIAEEALPIKRARGKKVKAPQNVHESDEIPEAKAKKKTATKNDQTQKAPVTEHFSDDEESDEVSEPAAKGKPTKKISSKPSTSKAEKTLLNNVTTDYSKVDFGIKEKFNFKITTWNVGGLRALSKKNPDYFSQENADIICMNEVKVGNEKEVPDVFKPDGYHAYWNIGTGFGGVALLSKVKPINVIHDIPDSEFRHERRMITAEFEKFFVISVYVVNAGRGLKTLDKRLEWNQVFDEYVKMLEKRKPVIIAGDMNVSHQEIDLSNPKTNKKNAGFTQEERDGFTKLLSYGFVDAFRHFNPDSTGAYTFWTYMNNSRAKNVGWRLDYFVVSKRLMMKHVKNSVIRSSILGSDHCPIVLFLNL